MAERRMFAKTIIDSDAFLDMPLSTQCLYFHLSMRADDEGFINNPKKVMRMIGASEDDLKVLITKKFILTFESGVIVIKHWKIHNYIRGDRLIDTKYQDEKELLELKDNGAYTLRENVELLEEKDNRDIRKMAYKNSSLPYSFTYKIRRAFEGKECPICKRKMNSSYKTSIPSIQHNIPISKGGLHELGNISVICLSCNTSISDNETKSLNSLEVAEVWDKIVELEKQKINWFWHPEILYKNICQSSDGQMSAQDRLGKDRLGKVNYIDDDSQADKLKESKTKYADYVKMKEKEYAKLVERFGTTFTDKCIEVLDNYKGSKGVTYKDDYRAILSWVVKRVEGDGYKPNPNENERQEEILIHDDIFTDEEYIQIMRGKMSKEEQLRIVKERTGENNV